MKYRRCYSILYILISKKLSSLTGPTPQKSVSPPTPNGTKKKEESPDVKEETVEEDGLYYGELDNDHMEYNEVSREL